jgi:hypothetical protein
MESSPLAPSQDLGQPPSGNFRSLLADAARFWEPRRLLYNFILFLVTVTWIMATWPHFRPALTLTSLFLMSILALIANACYSAAYFLDIPLQSSSTAATRNRFRWGLWILGTLFAFVLANYWIADEIYPDFH